MVAGAYAKSSSSRSRPYVLKYAPSHAERPVRRNSREKGKGWQRSKSSMYDYGAGSDLYFSEERMLSRRNRPRRPTSAGHGGRGNKSVTSDSCYTSKAKSSMSGRGTDKNSSFYEIDCPAKRTGGTLRRRASVEAVVRSAKPDSNKGLQGPAGPPIQKRMLTVMPDNTKKCITPNDDFYGWTAISKDKDLVDVHITEREGPKARPYVPRFESGAEAVGFPIIEKGDIEAICEQRRMEMLVTTSDFKERGRGSEECYEGFLTEGAELYPNHIEFRPTEGTPFAKSVNEIRLELRDFVVPEDRIMPGRLFIDLREPVKVDSIGLDINKTMATVGSDGQVRMSKPGGSFVPELKLLPNRQGPLYIPELATPEERAAKGSTYKLPPSEFAIRYPYPRNYRLCPGRHTIPFELYVPENQIPSFTYVDPITGVSAVNNYSLEAQLRLSGKSDRTGRIPIEVPALGKRGVGMSLVDRNHEPVCANKYFTKPEGLYYTLGRIDDVAGYDKPRDVTGTIYRVVKIPELNHQTRTMVSNPNKMSSGGKTNSVVDKYNSGIGNKPLKDSWSHSWYNTEDSVESKIPSVKTDKFSCDYELEIDTGTEKYIGNVVLVDRYDDKDFKRNDLSPAAQRLDFVKRA